MENDRCDIEFTYDWKTVNHYLDYLVEEPTYLLNAGDAFSIEFKSITPDKVELISNSYTIALTNNALKWSGTIPSTYTNKESYSIVINGKYCLYQGLLNYVSEEDDLKSIVQKNTEDILELQTQVKTNTANIVTNSRDIFTLKEKVSQCETNITDLQLRMTSLEARVKALEDK